MRKFTVLLLLACSLFAYAQKAPSTQDKKEVARLEQLRDSLTGTQGTPAGDIPTTLNGKAPEEKVKEILSNPIYRDQVSEQKGSWLNDALETLFRKIGDRASNLMPKQSSAPGIGGAAIFTNFVIWILVAVLAAFIVYMIASIAYKKRKAESATADGGLIDDDEVDRSSDEWLTQADKLANEGRFREAVRCLYLASLIRLDEAKILRFERHETNWEHLYRYKDAPGRLAAFDLTPLTQQFDQIWYGFNTQGMPDVVWFRSEYQVLLDAIKAAKA
ncbi:MAG: DUF4129 domain-containing protein [Fimbriimonadaceae bacterium]|nr:DUF4129 domain-containing protein [Fimbriimonadaceae bacterium]